EIVPGCETQRTGPVRTGTLLACMCCAGPSVAVGGVGHAPVLDDFLHDPLDLQRLVEWHDRMLGLALADAVHDLDHLELVAGALVAAVEELRLLAIADDRSEERRVGKERRVLG